MDTNSPPSLRWIPKAAKSFERSLGGDLYGWELVPQVDPLKWVFHLRLLRHIQKEEVPFFRSLLKEWCNANDAVYQKSEWGKWDFKAMIIIKGLGPIRENDPFQDS